MDINVRSLRCGRWTTSTFISFMKVISGGIHLDVETESLPRTLTRQCIDSPTNFNLIKYSFPMLDATYSSSVYRIIPTLLTIYLESYSQFLIYIWMVIDAISSNQPCTFTKTHHFIWITLSNYSMVSSHSVLRHNDPTRELTDLLLLYLR